MMTRLIVSLILLISSTPLLAQSWYQVNLVVFENRAGVSGNEVLDQPEGVQFEMPDNAVFIDAIPEGGDGSGFQRTTPIDSEFNNTVAALQRSSGYKVLLVKSWSQPGLERNQALPVVISGGDAFGNHHQLEGTVRLVLSRYLHLEADLWLGDYVLQVEQPLNWNDEAAQPAPMTLTDETAEPAATGPVYVPTHLYRLLDSRRMRSKELHYIDHPKLGIVVKVIPLTTSTPAETAE